MTYKEAQHLYETINNCWWATFEDFHSARILGHTERKVEAHRHLLALEQTEGFRLFYSGNGVFRLGVA